MYIFISPQIQLSISLMVKAFHLTLTPYIPNQRSRGCSLARMIFKNINFEPCIVNAVQTLQGVHTMYLSRELNAQKGTAVIAPLSIQGNTLYYTAFNYVQREHKIKIFKLIHQIYK